MSTIDAQTARAPLLASPRHTLTLCVIFLGIAALGYANSQSISAGKITASGLTLYLPLLATQWVMFAVIFVGLRKRGTRLRDVIADSWAWRDVGTDISAGIMLLAGWLTIEWLWSIFGPLHTGHSAGDVLHPRTGTEVWVWIALSLSAGFVEELAFRGYLQRQFGAMLASPFLGLILQGVLFGVSHGYQGLDPVVRITTLGLLFGTVALVRKSTRPGMVAHALIDVIGGLLP